MKLNTGQRKITCTSNTAIYCMLNDGYGNDPGMTIARDSATTSGAGAS